MKNTKPKCHFYVQLSDRAEIIVQCVWLEIQAAPFTHKIRACSGNTHYIQLYYFARTIHIILCQSSTRHWTWLSTKIKHKAKEKNLLHGEYTFSMPKSDCQSIPNSAGLAPSPLLLDEPKCMQHDRLEKSVIRENHSCRRGSSIHCLPVAVPFRAVLSH